jgi:hypothetical protein
MPDAGRSKESTSEEERISLNPVSGNWYLASRVILQESRSTSKPYINPA